MHFIVHFSSVEKKKSCFQKLYLWVVNNKISNGRAPLLDYLALLEANQIAGYLYMYHQEDFKFIIKPQTKEYFSVLWFALKLASEN